MVSVADPAAPPERGFVRRTNALRLGAFALAVIGSLAGIYLLAMHLATDPLADVHAYYNAGARLNAGQPLYAGGLAADDAYLYPPLLAILFRPLALLPYDVVAVAWEGLVLACLVATLWRLGLRQSRVWLAVGMTWACPSPGPWRSVRPRSSSRSCSCWGVPCRWRLPVS